MMEDVNLHIHHMHNMLSMYQFHAYFDIHNVCQHLMVGVACGTQA
jgi:hypothetical protein